MATTGFFYYVCRWHDVLGKTYGNSPISVDMFTILRPDRNVNVLYMLVLQSNGILLNNISTSYVLSAQN